MINSAAHVCIARNIPGNPAWEGSFYERLVEYGEWNINEFWKLHLALTGLVMELNYSKDIDRSLALSVVRIYQRVSGSIAAHHDENDVFEIANLANDELHKYKERFDLAVAGVFSGEVLPESSYDLTNPLIGNNRGQITVSARRQ